MPDGITGGYAGIAVESANGGNISKITVENIEMDGISAPFLIWLGDRLNYGGETVGGVSEISLCNINARNIEMPLAITGCKSKGDIYRVKNITLQNINAAYRNTGEALSIRKNVDDISMSDYPEITRVSHIYFISHKLSGYWDLPCYSLFVRYGDNIDYTGVKTTPRSCNERNEFYLRDNI